MFVYVWTFAKGRPDPGETPEEAAIRETEEETGLLVKNLRFGGDLYFEFTNGHSIRGYVFETDSWEGTPEETIEALPFWCQENEIPYEQMWTDDSWWYPHFLEGRQFRGRFIFNDEKMLSMSLDVESCTPEEGIPRAQS